MCFDANNKCKEEKKRKKIQTENVPIDDFALEWQQIIIGNFMSELTGEEPCAYSKID